MTFIYNLNELLAQLLKLKLQQKIHKPYPIVVDNVKKLARILEFCFIPEIYKYTHCIVIKGLPGVGKTTLILRALRYLRNKKVVYAVPRRQLKRWVFEAAGRYLLTWNIYNWKAKDEFPECPLYSESLYTVEEMPEVESLPSRLRLMVKCIYLRNKGICPKQCPFLNQVRELTRLIRKYRNLLVVCSFFHSFVLNTLFGYKFDIYIFDEVEEFISFVSNLRITPKELEEYKKLCEKCKDPELRDILMRILLRLQESFDIDNDTGQYFYAFPIFKGVDVCILMSATYHPLLNAIIVKNEHKPDIIYQELQIPLRKQIQDIIISYYAPIFYNDIYKERWIASDGKQLRIRKEVDRSLLYKMIEVTKEIVDYCTHRNLKCGIICRNKEVANLFCFELTREGYDVYYGKSFREAMRHDHVIIVPGDRLYRGISLDKDVIIAQYQGRRIEDVRTSLHPAIKFTTLYSPEPDWYNIITEGLITLNHAINVQAIFRFIREHNRRHVLVLLDRRVLDALNVFFPDYVNNLCKVYEVKSLNELVSKLYEVLR